MTWVLVLWSLRILITFLTLLSSFKSLRKPVTRQRRAALASKAASSTSLSSADRTRRRGIKANLTSWVVWASFCAAERVADRTIGWIMPLYDEIKIASLLSILVWREAGAQLVFIKVIKPLVTPYERPLDAIGFVANEVLGLVLAALLFIPRWIGRRWLSGAGEDEVRDIMKFLRIPSRPPLARELATSIEAASALATKDSRPPPPSVSSVPISHPRRAPTSTLSASTNRLPPLRTSTSGARPPTKQAVRAEVRHVPIPSTSHRIPNTTARKISGPSLITSLYPTLPPPFPSLPILSRLPQPSTSQKGKQRASSPPSPPRALTPPATPPPTYFAPPTPAPPGHFAFSPASLPSRTLDLRAADVVGPSPREKARSAIAGLSRELEAENGGSGRKRGRESEGLVMGGKRARKDVGGKKEVKKGVKKGGEKGKRRAVSEEDSESANSFDLSEEDEEEEDDSEATEESTRPAKKAATRRPPPRREAAPSPRSSWPRAKVEDALPRKAATSVAGKAAPARRAAASVGNSVARKPVASGVAKKTEASTLRTSTSSVSRTKLASSVSRPSARKREEEAEELPKPKRKPRRVLLGVQRGETSDGEQDGVPVIRRRAGRQI